MATRRAATESHERAGRRHGSLDETGRRKMLDRMRRIEGQIRGIARMVEEERYCPDVLVQMAAVGESLRASARVLIESHLRHCVTDAIRSKDHARAEAVYDEISDLFSKYAR